MPPEETVHRLVGQRYRLLETLGRGGMGTVWRGHDELLRRQVAVKHVAIPSVFEGEERGSTRRRVMREAQAAARLSHPASVTVFDVLEDEGSVYIVMELVEADTLAARVERQGPLSVDEAVRLGLELVGALEAAHRQGIVHRDVKPSNVMMLPTGAVKLTDFGIASLKDDPALTKTGQVLGSPSYMAPEQALGHSSGEEVDWWGLGATLYYALEGRPPFGGLGALATLTAVVNDDPAPPERAGALAGLLGRLLAKDPDRRPGASELRTLLRRHADPAGGGASAEGPAPVEVTQLMGRAEPSPAAVPQSPVPQSPVPQSPVPQAPVPPRPPGRVLEGPSRSRAPALALLGVLVLLVGLVAWGAGAGDDEPGPTTSPTQAAEGGGEAGSGPGASDRATGAAGAREGPAEGVPADWVTYTDPDVGYRVDHPPGWRVGPPKGTRTDITDPATGSYLRVDWTDTPGPSPEGAWEAQSQSFGGRHDQYQEIRIEPTTYKGFDAAVWEYAYSDGGSRLHAVNLGMVAGEYGFALNFQTPEDRWDDSQALFQAFKASFQVPG